MEKEILEKINQDIFTKFPYLKDSKPEISQQSENAYLLIYKGSVKTANVIEMPISVRVVTDSQGKILKLTSSR